MTFRGASALFLYRFIWLFITPLLFLALAYRCATRRESWRQVCHRFGISNARAIALEKKPIWVHAASIGESRVALNLVERLGELYRDDWFLITTTSTSSAALVSTRLPPRTMHQLAPCDDYFAVSRFFARWRPRLGLIIESELWPNLVNGAAAYCHLLLINGRMSDRSFGRWSLVRTFVGQLLTRFACILCQSARDAAKYSTLTAPPTKVGDLGNLKLCLSLQPNDDGEQNALKAAFANRPILVAASTHRHDEEVICDLYRALREEHSQLLVVIAPRHPSRGSSIAKIARARNLSVARRSCHDAIHPETQLYVADTLGELPRFLQLSSATFIGGSFRNGGHNPIEAAQFQAPIIFGPDMTDFQSVADEFVADRFATQIGNFDELVAATRAALAAKSLPRTSVNEILRVRGEKIFHRYLDAMAPYLS